MNATASDVEVSIVIPAYGRPAYLRELLSSLQAPTSVGVEVIVIDDGSPTPIHGPLVDDLRDMSVRLVRQENAGVAAARNAGARLARGEFLMFVDDDDLLPAGSLEWRRDFLRANPHVVGIAGRCEFIRDSHVIDTEPVRWSGELTRWDLLIQNRFYSPGQVLFRRAAFERTAGCRLDCLGSDDWALWIDLARIGPIHADERIGLQYRLHGGNFSRNIATMSRGAERVADAAVTTLCDHHSAIGDSLATNFVHAVYAPKLAAAAHEASAAGEWKRVADIADAQLRLAWRRLETRARRKAALVRHFGRWRMPADELLRLGRHCPACAETRPRTPSAPQLGALHVPA